LLHFGTLDLWYGKYTRAVGTLSGFFGTLGSLVVIFGTFGTIFVWYTSCVWYTEDG